MTRFLIVPQWQGSPAARAMHLVDGAEAIAGDLPRARTVRVEVPTSAGEALDTGIRRYSALSRTADAVRDALAAGAPDTRMPEGSTPAADLDAAAAPTEAAAPSEPALVVGGDCGVAVPAIAHAAAAHDRLAVVWFDAHGDLNSPASSPSGAFAGMALRAVIDDLPLPSGGPIVPAERVILAGARELDDAEETAAMDAGVLRLSVEDLDGPERLADAVAATGATALYIHVDLDVLDPAVISGVGLPVPFGLSLDALLRSIAAARARVPLVGASIAGFAPASPAAAVDDLGTILRVVGALA